MITIEGELSGKVEQVFNFLSVILKEVNRNAMQQTVDAIVDTVKTYPPETEANEPPPPYYRRGVGTVLVNKIIYESEKLGDNWQSEVNESDNTVEGRVFSNVSYAPWVHGTKNQTSFHAKREWPKLEDIAIALVGNNISVRVQERGATTFEKLVEEAINNSQI